MLEPCYNFCKPQVRPQRAQILYIYSGRRPLCIFWPKAPDLMRAPQLHSKLKSFSPCVSQEHHFHPVWLQLSHLLDRAGWIHRFLVVGFSGNLSQCMSRIHQTSAQEHKLGRFLMYHLQTLCHRKDRRCRGGVAGSLFLHLEDKILSCEDFHFRSSSPSVYCYLKILKTEWVQNVITLQDFFKISHDNADKIKFEDFFSIRNSPSSYAGPRSRLKWLFLVPLQPGSSFSVWWKKDFHQDIF